MENIGKFQVVEKIGEGGFGVIYKGLDPHIKRHVAIKSCTSHDKEIRSRFVQEAQISGNLHHRHIVTVYDFGTQNGVPFLVQEYLSGEDLDRKIKRRDYIPFPEKLLYLMQIARGLEYAHAQGIIHRDIKPANIRILEDGTAKIMDFGIAKLANQETSMTQTGMTLGTAAYLAPEQIQGQPIDQRTDIFSYGVMAYELLTYERPFVGQHISTVLYQILNETPRPPSARTEGIPPELDALVMKCLAKEPERRYWSCSELLEDIDHILKSRRTSGGGQIAAGSLDSELAKTRPFLAPPVVGSAPAAPDLSQQLTRIENLDELELAGTLDTSRTPHSISSTQVLRHRGFAWGRWVAAVLTVVGVSLGAYLFLQGKLGDASKPAAEVTHEAQRAQPPQEETAPDAGQKPSHEASSKADAAPSGSQSEPSASSERSTPPPADTRPQGGTPTTSSTVPVTPQESPKPAPPQPPPEPAHLKLETAWSPKITVTVNGRKLQLDKTRELELPPGTHRFVFRYDDGDYHDDGSRVVHAKSGETLAVTVPLERPGLLQVQPDLMAPQQGYVLVGSNLLGPTPVRDRRMRPGHYRLTIQKEPGDPTGALKKDVEIPPGTRLVVTFNLDRGTLTERTIQLAGSS